MTDRSTHSSAREVSVARVGAIAAPVAALAARAAGVTIDIGAERSATLDVARDLAWGGTGTAVLAYMVVALMGGSVKNTEPFYARMLIEKGTPMPFMAWAVTGACLAASASIVLTMVR